MALGMNITEPGYSFYLHIDAALCPNIILTYCNVPLVDMQIYSLWLHLG